MSGGDFGWDEQKKQIKHELEKLEIWRVNSNGGVLKIPDKETIEKNHSRPNRYYTTVWPKRCRCILQVW